jgi:hypothetical protein
MFTLFGVRGSPCPRCDHVNQRDGSYCAQCGISLGQAHPLLRNNRWLPAENEVAVFFGVERLSGVFSKTLQVPGTARAYILQGQQITEVPPGEYQIEDFFGRLDQLLRDRSAEILITRSTPFELTFNLSGIASAEFLALDVACILRVKIEPVSAFSSYFMQAPGAITLEQLQTLIQPLLRQVLIEFLAGQALLELANNRQLREQLNERVQSTLALRMAHFGLALVQVETLSLQHQKWNENRELVGNLALIFNAKRVEADHAERLAQLYSEQQWAKIEQQEQAQRQQLRSAQLARKQREQRAELVLEEREQLQALRVREIELYGRIIEAHNRKQALERGAREVLTKLEHDLKQDASQRHTEEKRWEQVRHIAQIKMRTELELEQIEAREITLAAQQQLKQQVLQWQWQRQLATIEQIGNEQTRRDELARLAQAKAQQAQHDKEWQDEQQQARLHTLTLERQARTRQEERLQAWQDELARQQQHELLRSEALLDAQTQVQIDQQKQKMADLARSGANADALAQQEKLLRTLEAQAAMQQQELVMQRARQQDQLDAEEQRSRVRQREQELEWQHTLRLQEQDQQQRLARYAALDQVSDLAKVALADLPNASLVADILKTRVQADMSAEQISAAKVLPDNEFVPGLVTKSVAQEREWQAQQAAKEREHVLAMLQASRDATPPPLLMRTCRQGHINLPRAKFCAECGAPLV